MAFDSFVEFVNIRGSTMLYLSGESTFKCLKTIFVSQVSNSYTRISDKDNHFIEQIKASLIESEAEKDVRSCGIYCAEKKE